MNNIPEWTLGDRLAKARRMVGLTQQQMADEFLVSRQSVVSWENDQHRPPRRKVLAWALRTGVDPVWIEYGDTAMGGPGHRGTGWLHGHRAIWRVIRTPKGHQAPVPHPDRHLALVANG